MDQKRPTVLVIDDNALTMTALAAILKERGHFVRSASDGMGALSLLEMPPHPEVVILDLLMPGMDGRSLIHELRSRSDTLHTPVIVTSALATEQLKAQVESIGADFAPGAVLQKPYEVEELEATIDRLLHTNAAPSAPQEGKSDGPLHEG